MPSPTHLYPHQRCRRKWRTRRHHRSPLQRGGRNPIQSTLDAPFAVLINPFDITIWAGATDASSTYPYLNRNDLASYSRINLEALDTIEISTRLTLPDKTDSDASLRCAPATIHCGRRRSHQRRPELGAQSGGGNSIGFSCGAPAGRRRNLPFSVTRSSKLKRQHQSVGRQRNPGQHRRQRRCWQQWHPHTRGWQHQRSNALRRY